MTCNSDLSCKLEFQMWHEIKFSLEFGGSSKFEIVFLYLIKNLMDLVRENGLSYKVAS